MASTVSHTLSLPFHRGAHLSLSTAIRKYIDTKYDQHPDMFRHDLEVIDKLRKDAVDVNEPHLACIKQLQSYAAQLVWIGGKFPIDLGAEFTWYIAPGYSDRPVVRDNLKFELLNILFNLAALYSQLAVSSPRNNTDGLKAGASYFAQAAGVLSHMQKEVLPELRMADPPEEMDNVTLESLIQLFLAQAQECFWQKAVMDGFRDANIAKLAAKVSDYYNLAGEAAVKSNAISSAWIHHMSAKHHHFAAAAQYRAARDCLEKKRFGEEVARLKDAAACVNDGLKNARGGFLNKTVVEDLNGLKSKLEEEIKRAEKDNDIIYLNVVPPKSELAAIERANMAQPKIPPQVANPYEYLGEKAEFGPALFSRLVPFAVHLATSIYEQRRDRLVHENVIQQLESLTEKIHTTLSSLGLPGSLQALEKPLGLPHSLVQHAEEIRQTDAIARVNRSFADISKLRATNLSLFEEGKSILAAEEDEDARMRQKYGTDRWTRPEGRAGGEGKQLWDQSVEIEGYFASSGSSDELVRQKFAAVEDPLILLSGPDRGLLDFVPSSRRGQIPEALKLVIEKLRSAYSDVLRLESRRRKMVESLREKSRTDDIKPEILEETARLERTYPTTVIQPVHFEDFFEKRLARLYDPELEAVEEDGKEQERCLSQVTRINGEFESLKKSVDSHGNREREKVLQTLDNAYFKYKEVVNNLDAARKFYNDLSRLVGPMFRDKAAMWAQERRLEAKLLEDELALPPLSALNISRPPPQPQQQYQSHPSQNQPPWANAQAGASRPHQPTPVAPIQALWDPSTGISFANPNPNGRGSPAPGTWDPKAGIKFS